MSLFVLDNKNISKAIHLLHPNEELFEIRLINGSYNASGYFTSADTAIKALQDFRPEWNSRTPKAKAANIFITLNPIDMSCYARQQHDCFMRPEGREPLPDKAGESTLRSRSGGEKGLRGGGAGKPRCS